VQLLIHLIMRLVGVVLLCLSIAVGWVMVDAHRAIDAETEASAKRVGSYLEGLYWQKLLWRGGMSKDSLLPSPEWATLRTLSVISPGICVTFAPPGQDPQQICSQTDALGRPAPAWFAAVNDLLFPPHEPVKRSLSVRDQNAGTVLTAAEPEAALRQSWQRVSVIVGIAAVMAAGIALLAALMIGHALLPARAIIDGLRKLELGDHSWRLPKFRTAEFSHIARAVNDLAGQLARTNAARAMLTKRLFQVQEEERRALARDLHDEFGQCLTATSALAALIEAGATPAREDLARDAREIAKIQRRMMTTLRTALVRLRSQDVDEIGLEASLRQLVAESNTRSATRAAFRLHVVGQLAALPKQIAIDVYRIAQECLTNAARHGSPTEVRLSVEHSDGRIALTVEDNGGGDAARIDQDQGHGVLGIRERIAALGGSLSIGSAPMGVRVAAIIPLLIPNLGMPASEAAA
jgi:signal transduction histidine kinase